jgi:hypothetical protein
MITSPIIGSSIYLRNVEFLSINGVDGLHHADLIKQLAGKNCIFLDLCYGNVNIKKRIKIDVCIADPEEIKKVDKAFTQCFEKGGLNDSAIIAFTEEVKNFENGLSHIAMDWFAIYKD